MDSNFANIRGEKKMIKADVHVHSDFSADTEIEMESHIKTAIKLGFESLCITDHYDMGYPNDAEIFDIEIYFKKIQELKEKYHNKIELLCGIELGLMPHLKEKISAIISKYNFDFIIGSSHLIDIDHDSCLKSFYEKRSEKEAYTEYFKSILQNVKTFSEYDVYGHLDYTVRYGPNKNKFFDFNDYKEIFEELLKIIIENNKGIEINTAGLRNGLGYPHPHKDILKMYKSLGGKIITVGSDAHVTEYLGHEFKVAEDLMKEIGFNCYAVYKNRVPSFYKF